MLHGTKRYDAKNPEYPVCCAPVCTHDARDREHSSRQSCYFSIQHLLSQQPPTRHLHCQKGCNGTHPICVCRCADVLPAERVGTRRARLDRRLTPARGFVGTEIDMQCQCANLKNTIGAITRLRWAKMVQIWCRGK